MVAIQPHNILISNSVVLVAYFRSLHFTRQQFWKAHPLGVKVREDFHAVFRRGWCSDDLHYNLMDQSGRVSSLM